jgi:hypothetical protein
MKIYLHYEPDNSMAATYIYQVKEQDTPDSVLAWFASEHKGQVRSVLNDEVFLIILDMIITLNHVDGSYC